MTQVQKIIAFFIILIPVYGTGQNVMIFHGDSIAVNDTALIKMDIENTNPFAAFQFDLLLPEGFEFIEGSAELSNRKTDHSIIASSIADDTIRFIAFSPMNSNFSGNEGQVLQFQLFAGNNPGIFPINLFDCILADAQGNNILSEVVSDSIFVSDPLGLLADWASQGIQIYPNPNNGIFNLSFPERITNNYLFKIMSMDGKLAFSKQIFPGSSTMGFNLTKYLDAGTFIIVLKNKHYTYRQKIIIQKAY
jgi:hypothetical protein